MIQANSVHPTSLYASYMEGLLAHSIQSQEWVTAIECLLEKPERLDRLSVDEFEALLMALLTNEHYDEGTKAYSVLLNHYMMDEMSERTLKAQTLEPIHGWSSTERDRVALFLESRFAEKISPFRLQQIYFNFSLAGRDTYRLGVLLGPYHVAGVNRVMRESGSLQHTARN